MTAAAVAAAALKLRAANLEDGTDTLRELIEDYGVAARAYVGLEACRLCGENQFGMGRFSAKYYTVQCRACYGINVADIPTWPRA